MGKEKNFFEIYSQFRHAPSKRFASPALQYFISTHLPKSCLLTCNPFSLGGSKEKATCFLEINTRTNDIACSWMLTQNDIWSKFANFVIIRRH